MSLDLDQQALLAEARAMPLSYKVRVLQSPGPTPRTVVVLGEAHLKLARASLLGKQLVEAFELRGVETFPVRRVLLGRLLMLLIVIPRWLLRALSLGLIKGSTITDARSCPKGETVLLEHDQKVPLGLHLGALHLTLFFLVSFLIVGLAQWLTWFPDRTLGQLFWTLLPLAHVMQQHILLTCVPAWLLRRHRLSWLILPMLAIVNERDRMMASGTANMLSQHAGTSPVLVIMGRAHVAGYERELVAQQGFGV